MEYARYVESCAFATSAPQPLYPRTQYIIFPSIAAVTNKVLWVGCHSKAQYKMEIAFTLGRLINPPFLEVKIFLIGPGKISSKQHQNIEF